MGEIVAMHENLVPDVSLGTHFLNELIEADMLYFALFPGREGNRVDAPFLMEQPNRLAEILPGLDAHADVVRVIDLPADKTLLYADAERQHVAILTDND